MASDGVMLRVAELSRCATALENDLGGWLAAVRGETRMEIHFSQLDAIQILVRVAVDRLRALKQKPPADPAALGLWSRQMTELLTRGRRAWGFFRDKLELRRMARLAEPLWVADTVAWDCYRVIMDEAVALALAPAASVREPPLTYIDDESSPMTWTRGHRPFDGRHHDLGNAPLPIPVIALPWDHVGNHWEQVAIAHEVGHDIEADLRLRADLVRSVEAAAPARADKWKRWVGEVFADLVALELMGPAFLDELANLLFAPEALVVNDDPEDPHPTPHVRIALCAAYARRLAGGPATLVAHVDALQALWNEQYAAVAHLTDLVADAPAVIEAVMDTGHPALQGHTMRELVSYTAAHHAQVQQAIPFLVTGLDRPPSMQPRHVVAAARFAAARGRAEDAARPQPEDAAHGATGQRSAFDTHLDAINDRTRELVHAFAPAGVRGGDASPEHKAQIEASFDALPI